MVRDRVTALRSEAAATACTLAGGGTVLLSRCLSGFMQSGDEIEFDPTLTTSTGTELRILRAAQARPKELYQTPIGYVTQPALDKRQDCFLRAEVPKSGLGIRAIHLPGITVRDHFYRGDRTRTSQASPTLYETLKVTPAASPGDLRLAFKIRKLELEAGKAAPQQFHDLERAFNLLMLPEVRSCYDALLRDPESPVLFPCAGFGSLLVAGELSRDGATFFAQRIISFLPERQHHRFRALLRRFDFLHDHAVYRDSRRMIEILVDPTALPLRWDSTWNQWKHLVGAKVGIEATFVRSGKYRFQSGEWRLASWWAALPSRLHVSLPSDIRDHLNAAMRTFRRFGQHSTALEQIRQRLETEPMERRELDRLCGDLGIPGDFDVAQISWKPDYDPFFYNHLRKRAGRVYLFRAEYIFDLERVIVVEVPAPGHATYIFAKPQDLDAFIRRYARASADDIRQNRDNIGVQLGFLARVMHGSNPRTWLKELQNRIGEPVDHSVALE